MAKSYPKATAKARAEEKRRKAAALERAKRAEAKRRAAAAKKGWETRKKLERAQARRKAAALREAVGQARDVVAVALDRVQVLTEEAFQNARDVLDLDPRLPRTLRELKARLGRIERPHAVATRLVSRAYAQAKSAAARMNAQILAIARAIDPAWRAELRQSIASERVKVTRAISGFVRQIQDLDAKYSRIWSTITQAIAAKKAAISPPAKLQDLLTVARETPSHGRPVRGIKILRLEDDSATLHGWTRDPSGERIALRGYEIWVQGERFFYWGRADVVGEYDPGDALDLHYGELRPRQEHMVLSWSAAA